ncbi:CubicO group peptidase, beta-lactamase class C family [Maribacter sedimenticola]|uniref:CubicO group peptidase, beta-lactamase class C family n=1 Tax=Maribacter sedimenticola TaxID=228956 RepID=A0ABY1SC49_9FLAO|nr:serine hydrolase [Maribacter sedimenticola]SNR25203.1 CubicO group peptidase, beta-lactamase class C family [Maribacter sedimenticola]
MRLQFIALIALFYFADLYAQEYYFPELNANWEQRSPNDFHIDESKLNSAVAFAEANEYSGSRDLRIAILKGFEREPFHQIMGPTKKRGGPAGLIIKDGYIVAQWGDIKRVDMTFSVTKSFLSTMAGLAEDKGLIRDTKDLVGDYIWDGTFDGAHNAKITWEHLLQQNSAWSGELWGGKDWADRPPRNGGIDDWKLDTPNEPGTVMEYNDVRVNVLAYALTHVWRKPMPLVLKEHIMDKIGASSTWRWFGYDNAWTEIDGLQMKSVTGGGHSGAGIFISAEDMARFGLLFLNNGKWQNEQLVSSNWIKKATTPSIPNVNYGFMWWLNKKGDRHWQGLSEDIYYAAGFGGNFIVIDKTNNMVVVTRWLEPNKIGDFMTKINSAFN